jgi:hypothetical protein
VSTATIDFRSLFTYAAEDASIRLPVSALASGGEHVHGELIIGLGGRRLPHLGFFGDDDVCFNTWLQELLSIKRALSAAEESTYVFDEGEQGQPAFEFSREGELLFTSVVASALSGAGADLSYQRVCCMWADFAAAVCSFKEELRSTVEREAGSHGESWWLENARSERSGG